MHIKQKDQNTGTGSGRISRCGQKSMDCSLTVNDMSPPLAACSDTTPEGQQPQSAIGDDSRSQPPSVTWEKSPSSPPGAPLNVTSGLKLSEAAEVARVALHTSCQSLAFADVEDIAKKTKSQKHLPSNLQTHCSVICYKISTKHAKDALQNNLGADH